MLPSDPATGAWPDVPPDWQELFGSRVWRILCCQARQRMGPELSLREAPSDVVQNALLRASRSLDQCRKTTTAGRLGWLRQIVINEAVEAYRRHRRELGEKGVRPLEHPSDQPDQRPSLLQWRMTDEELVWLGEALGRLSEDQRAVLEMTFFDQLPSGQIAQRLGTSEQNVRQIRSRALRRLAELRKEMRPDWSSKP